MEKNKSTVFDLNVENIPDDWGIVSLKAIDLGGKENIDPRAYPGDDFEYYSIPAYQEGGKPVIEKGKNILSQKIIVQNDSVLFGKLNPRVEKVWHVQSETGYKKIASTEFIPIYPDQEKIFPRYLYYVEWSKFVMPKAKTLVTGSTPSRQRVDPTSFFKIKIPLPSRTEQVRIAFILSKLQQAIEQQEQIITKTKELKRSLMHWLFTYGLWGEELKETEIGLIPKSWEIVEVDTLGEIITGTTPPTKNKEYYKGGGFQFISPVDLGDTKYVYKTEKEISSEGLRVSRILPKDAVLVVCIGSTTGKVGLTFKDKSTTNQQINTIICRKEFNPHFIYYLLDFKSDYIRSLSTPSPVPILSKGKFQRAVIPMIKNKQEQDKIAEILSAIDEKIEKAKYRKQTLQSLFKTMLNQLMTGKVRVKDIDFGEINV
ncbi:MAG TPA: hypothetical protein DD713_02980 [Nitrospiraceae bacterium]|nr:hypothetical protein [Nitrospiraceae bacterium]